MKKKLLDILYTDKVRLEATILALENNSIGAPSPEEAEHQGEIRDIQISLLQTRVKSIDNYINIIIEN